MKSEIFHQIFEKVLNMKFHQNPFIRSRIVPLRQTDMKLIVAFRNFANAPKKSRIAADVFFPFSEFNYPAATKMNLPKFWMSVI
jgi:hypothetical protein